MLRLWVFFVLNFVLPSPLAASRNVTTIARQAHYTKQPHYATQPQNITQEPLHTEKILTGKSNTYLFIAEIVGISVGFLLVILVVAFAVLICCMRRKLPDGLPKPSICATIKLGFELIRGKCCPCCKKSQYAAIPE